MRLLAIRSFDEQDPLPLPGAKPPAPATPAPGPVPVPGKPGLIRHPDGKLETDLPPPPPAPHAIPPAPAMDYSNVGGHFSDVRHATPEEAWHHSVQIGGEYRLGNIKWIVLEKFDEELTVLVHQPGFPNDTFKFSSRVLG